jgi:tetratricopeptide (TPR) repeat protein
LCRFDTLRLAGCDYSQESDQAAKVETMPVDSHFYSSPIKLSYYPTGKTWLVSTIANHCKEFMKLLLIHLLASANRFRAIITPVSRLPSRGIYLQVLLLGVITVLLIAAPHPQAVTNAMRTARLALETGTYRAVFNSLSQAAEYFPWRADLRIQAGEAAYQADDPETAIQYLTQAIDPLTLPPTSLLILGDAYLDSGNFQQAIQVWQSIPEEAGFSEAVLLRMLDLHRNQQDYSGVIEDLKALLRLHPGEAGYLYQTPRHH